MSKQETLKKIYAAQPNKFEVIRRMSLTEEISILRSGVLVVPSPNNPEDLMGKIVVKNNQLTESFNVSLAHSMIHVLKDCRINETNELAMQDLAITGCLLQLELGHHNQVIITCHPNLNAKSDYAIKPGHLFETGFGNQQITQVVHSSVRVHSKTVMTLGAKYYGEPKCSSIIQYQENGLIKGLNTQWKTVEEMSYSLVTHRYFMGVYSSMTSKVYYGRVKNLYQCLRSIGNTRKEPIPSLQELMTYGHDQIISGGI